MSRRLADALGGVALLGEGGAELVAVSLASHRDRQLDLGLTDRQVHPLAVMLDGDDVRALGSHELEELEKLTDQVAIMARGRIAAVGHVAQIRDLLDDHQLSIRVTATPRRELAAALLDLPEVVGLELGEDDTLVVRARNPQRFFRAFTKPGIEERTK